MCFYWVYNFNDVARTAALRDDAGAFHLVRLESQMLRIGEHLEGQDPAPGLRLLVDSSGREFRALFERVDCGRREAMQHLRPRLQGVPVSTPQD